VAYLVTSTYVQKPLMIFMGHILLDISNYYGARLASYMNQLAATIVFRITKHLH
jgi:hypothetical protein